jgi:phospholipid/cholesterol/gamma-HCH transport system substrate-binding protein
MKLETKVGAFFIAAVGVMGLLILRMEKLEIFGKNSESKVYTEFDQVAGLNVQGAIRVAGVKVGTVTAIDLDGKRAKVTLALPKGFLVYQDASAQLSSIGILGEKYIDLDPGHPAAGPMAEGGTVPSRTSMSLDNLMETLGSIGKDVKSITGALSQSIGGEQGRQKLDEIVDNVRILTAQLRSMAQENHGAINNTMANVQQMTADLRERLPLITQQFQDLGKNLNDMVNQGRPELQGVLTDVRRLTASLQATADNVKDITGKMDRGEGTIGKLLTDESTVNKVNAAVDNLNSMLGGFRSMELDVDMNAARWTKRGDSMAGIGVDIVPAHDHWYSLAFNSTPDGKIGTSSATQTVDPGTGLPVTTISKTTTTDQSFTLSAQFVKRLHENFVLSAGMVEGKGGGGVEYRALDDRFRFGLLGYDFTKRDDKPKPRYRATTSYQFYKNIYAQAGVQDIANKELRTFFVGGGIRWKDEDLKKLVGLASVGK